MKRYYVTVEGLVSRVIRVTAADPADAAAEARREFTATVGALNAEVTTINKEPELCSASELKHTPLLRDGGSFCSGRLPPGTSG